MDHRKQRPVEMQTEMLKNDEINYHMVLTEDMFSLKLHDALTRELGGAKVDLIIERMGMGLEYVPAQPYFTAETLQDWYDLLNEGGINVCAGAYCF